MPTLTVNHIRILFCITGAIILGLMAMIDYLSHQPTVAFSTLALALVLIVNGILMMFRSHDAKNPQADALFLILLASFSLLSADQNSSHIDWAYFFPIAAFFLFSLRTATLCVLAYTPLAIYIFIQYSPALAQAQTLFTFLAISTVALFLAMVKSRTNQLLEPLISSDLQTGAQLENFLRPALKKEINRAEREGTGLLLVYLQLKSTNQKQGLSAESVSQCAQAIAKQLRPFDQYYLIHNNNFAIIMPHANTEDAMLNVKRMITEMPDFLQDKIAVGFASLNVGDTEESLLHQVQQELIHV